MRDSTGERTEVAPFRCHGVLATPQVLRDLRHELTGWVRAAGVSEDRVQDVVLASYEALANVADHAYAGEGAVDVDAAIGAGRVEVTITDHGRWRTPVPDPRPVSVRGRGLLLLRASADDADITAGDDGTVVRLSWKIDG